MKQRSPARIGKVHYWRAKHLWSVVFSDHCEHYRELDIQAPLISVLSETYPKAYFKGKFRVIPDGDKAVLVP